VLGGILLGLSTIYAIVVIDLIVESASSGAKKLTLFGTQIAEVTKWNGVYIVAALAASAALFLVVSLAYLRGRRLEKKMAADLDTRFNELSERNATFEARNELLTWRIEELTDQMEQLTHRRDEALAEIDRLETDADKLRSRSTDEAREAAAQAELDRLLVLPESQPAQPVSSTPSPPNPPAGDPPRERVDEPKDPNDPFA
jgi:DNA anti-recombination protein RmuC